MHYQVKKLETCFADAENYEYHLAVTGEQIRRLLASDLRAEVRVNEGLRRPTFIATLADGVRAKGVLDKTYIRVGFEPGAAAAQKAAFENWLDNLPVS